MIIVSKQKEGQSNNGCEDIAAGVCWAPERERDAAFEWYMPVACR